MSVSTTKVTLVNISQDRNNAHYRVESESEKGVVYDVVIRDGVYFCTCPDFLYRLRECKHIKAVKAFRDGYEKAIDFVEASVAIVLSPSTRTREVAERIVDDLSRHHKMTIEN